MKGKEETRHGGGGIIEKMDSKKKDKNEKDEGSNEGGLIPDGLGLKGLRLRKFFTDLKCRTWSSEVFSGDEAC